METYYTTENFILYILTVLVILLLIPLLVHWQNGGKSFVLIGVTGGIVSSLSLLLISRTCPYENAAEIISRSGLVMLFASGSTLLLLFIHSLLRRTSGLFSFTESEANRWINRILRDSYLVLDREGYILRGNLSPMTGLSQPGEQNLKEYLTSLIPLTRDLSKENEIFDALDKGYFSEGKFTMGETCFKWTYSPLGEKRVEGFLFSLLDISEENRLLEEREKQEVLARIRIKRVEDLGRQNAERERDRRKNIALEKSTGVINVRLKELLCEIDQLAGIGPEEKMEALAAVLCKGESTMEKIRETVHSMEESERDIS